MAKRLSKNGKKIGRPSKLSKPVIGEAITQAICDNIRDGAPKKAAVVLAGIRYQTFLNWYERAKEGEQPFLDFMDRIELVEYEKQKELMGKWQGHCDNDWRAIDRFLQVRFKDEFGEKAQSGNLNVLGENVLIVVPKPCDTIEEWQEHVQQYLKNRKGNGSDDSPKLVGKS